MSRFAALVVLLFAWSLTTHGKYSASGDEPHYLIISQSIVADHDLDVANNYANNDGRLFGHDHLERGLHAIPARSGHIRSIHDIGLSVALVPVYYVAQRLSSLPSAAMLRRFRMDRGLFAYSIISLFLIAFTVYGLTLLGDGLSELGGAAAGPLVFLIGISPPVVSHAFLVFPEAVAFVASCAVVWFCLKPSTTGDTDTFLLLSLVLSLLPWMHHKFLIYSPALLALAVIKRWDLRHVLTPSELWTALAFFLVPQALLLAWTYREWGTLGGALTTASLPFSVATFQTGWAGLFIDRQSGLLAYAPFFWLLPACAILTWRRTWPFLAAALLVYVPAAAFVIGWWAGFSPAARYLVPVVPLCAVPIADALRFRAVRWMALLFALPQIAIDLAVWQHPRWLWPAGSVNPALEGLGSIARTYESWLPRLQTDGWTDSVVPVVLLVLGVTAMTVGTARLETKTRALLDVKV
jgi:hypothetical protein